LQFSLQADIPETFGYTLMDKKLYMIGVLEFNSQWGPGIFL
jgi:hypothetical protein